MTERPGIAQVSAAEAREIRGGFRDLFATMRETFQPPQITILRPAQDTGATATIVTFTPEIIRLPRRQELGGGANTGRVSVTQPGAMHVDATLDIRPDDRFQIDGQWAVVTDVAPEVNAIGYRSVDFRVES